MVTRTKLVNKACLQDAFAQHDGRKPFRVTAGVQWDWVKWDSRKWEEKQKKQYPSFRYVVRHEGRV